MIMNLEMEKERRTEIFCAVKMSTMRTDGRVRVSHTTIVCLFSSALRRSHSFAGSHKFWPNRKHCRWLFFVCHSGFLLPKTLCTQRRKLWFGCFNEIEKCNPISTKFDSKSISWVMRASFLRCPNLKFDTSSSVALRSRNWRHWSRVQCARIHGQLEFHKFHEKWMTSTKEMIFCLDFGCLFYVN